MSVTILLQNNVFFRTINYMKNKNQIKKVLMQCKKKPSRGEKEPEQVKPGHTENQAGASNI